MIRLIFSTLLLCLPAAVTALEITVRSGEHGNFTRLAFKLPVEREWNFEQSDTVGQLKISGGEITFDISTVFSRISKNRLSSISQVRDDTLRLDLNCDCPIKVFEESDGYVVLDIGDPKPEGGKNQKTPTPKDMRAELTGLWLHDAGRVSRPGLLSELPLAINAEPARAATDSPKADPEAREDSNLNSIQGDILQLAEMELRQKLARGVSQGLLAADGARADPVAQTMAGDSNGEPRTSKPSLQAITSVDRDLTRRTRPALVPQGSRQCLRSELVAVHDWGQDASFASQISEVRRGLAGEFDQLTSSGLLRLARLYVYFGYGAEALATLDQFRASGNEAEILRAVAHLVDGDDLPGPHPMQGQTHCSDAVALWSLLAERMNSEGEINAESIVQTFVKLPQHLRKHLGPKLVDKLSSSGEREAANLILRMINRIPVEPEPEQLLAHARVAQASGKEVQAEAIIEKVANGRSEQAMYALVKMTEKRFHKREAMSPDEVALLSSYGAEAQHLQNGSQILRAYALALASAMDFDSALEVARSIREEDEARTENDVLRLLAESGDDIVFLEKVLNLLETHTADPPNDLALLVARRLLSLGFAEPALVLLSEPKTGSLGGEFAIARARSYLALQKPRRALLEIVSEHSSEADRVRANALEHIGLHEEAAELARSSLEETDVERSQQSAKLVGESDPPLDAEAIEEKHLAKESLSVEKRFESLSSLGAARDLLSQSEDVRKNIEILLR